MKCPVCDNNAISVSDSVMMQFRAYRCFRCDAEIGHHFWCEPILAALTMTSAVGMFIALYVSHLIAWRFVGVSGLIGAALGFFAVAVLCPILPIERVNTKSNRIVSVCFLIVLVALQYRTEILAFLKAL